MSSSDDKAKTQKISDGNSSKTATLTSFITKLFHPGRTTVFPIYGDENELGLQNDEDVLRKSRNTENLRDLHQSFEIKKEIASGGQGIIYTAFDKDFQRTVAIKTLNEDLKGKESARKTFLNEAALTAKLEHPSIVPIHGLYSDNDNGLHLAMKLIRGKTLKMYLKVLSSQYKIMKKKEIRHCENILFSQKIELFLKICSAVAFMHRKNVIHRDLKPENIMIGDLNETYIMDLGIAVHKDPDLREAPPAGTPQYIAPEVVSGEFYDHRSDIFLLGLILYELFCIQPAYPQKEMEESIAQARIGKIQPVKHAFGVEINREMQYIIQKATRRNPGERYQSVEEFANDIRAHIAMQPVKANPHKALAFLKNFLIKRYRLLIGLILLAFLLFFASLGYIFYQNALESDKQNRATQISSQIMSEGGQRVAAVNDLIRKYENLICQITEEASVRLSADVAGKTTLSKFYTPDSPPEKLEYSKTYGAKVNMDHLIYIFPKDSQQKPTDAIKIAPMKQSFYRTIRDSKESHVYASDNEIKYQLQHQKCAPFQKIFFGLRTGLYVCYPYIELHSEYDPRTRPWYERAVETEGKRPAWTKPYLDASSKEFVITCSNKILSPEDGTFLGVCAVDITLDSFIEILRKNVTPNPNRLGIFLLDEEGYQILDIATGKIDKKNTKVKFQNDLALKRFLNSDCGQFIVRENDQDILYFFMKIPSLNWIYVEKFNHKNLMEQSPL